MFNRTGMSDERVLDILDKYVLNEYKSAGRNVNEK